MLRPQRDSQRQLICGQVDAYMASAAPDADLVSFYRRGFADAQARFVLALADHRARQSTLRAAEQALAEADDANDEALRKLSSHTQLKHGVEGLRTLEAMWGGISRSHLTGLARAEQARRVGDFLAQYAAGSRVSLNEDYVDEVRTTHAAVAAALVADSQARGGLRAALAELMEARLEFDRLWTALARYAQAVLGPDSAALVPELGAARKAAGSQAGTEPDNDEAGEG